MTKGSIVGSIVYFLDSVSEGRIRKGRIIDIDINGGTEYMLQALEDDSEFYFCWPDETRKTLEEAKKLLFEFKLEGRY